MVVKDIRSRKPLEFVGRSLVELRSFPAEVMTVVGYALDQVQLGKKPREAKPLSGFRGASVLEIVDDFEGDTYRAVYTVRFAKAIYLLHCFQKKSKKGIATPKPVIDLIKQRLKVAEEHYKEKYEK